MGFVQLQVKSSYTLLESTITIDNLIESAKSRGYEAIALTDRNVLYGALKFYEKAKENNIKPIIGLTLDVEGILDKNTSYPLIFLAKNYKGYQQLLQLSSKYMTTNQPVSIKFVQENQSELIVITPGKSGEIESRILNNELTKAKEVSTQIRTLMTDLYIGIQLDERILEKKDDFIQLGIPLIGLGNIEYIDSEDSFATEVLKKIQSGEELELDAQPKKDYSLIDSNDMFDNFKEHGLEEAAKRTVQVAKESNIEIELGNISLPQFQIPEGYNTDSYLKKLCIEGLHKKVQNIADEYKDRLEKELNVISKMGFSDYFLIVWDVMNYAHQENIVTGAGRGSAAASLVAYSLDITDVDPIKYRLLFERFLNEERYTMPDIDLDFPDNKRTQILKYVNEKYGSDHVAQIATFGTFAAKQSLRDSGRVFGLNSEELKKWSKAIPSIPNVTLRESYEKSEQLRYLVNESNKNKRIFDTAKRIEGLPRHVSTHAAGVVLSSNPLIKKIPIQEGTNELLLTQFTMEDVEKSGLLKMDFLALKNLTILSDSIQFSKYENKGDKICVRDIPLNDPETLSIFKKGDTNGVFQFESDGIKNVLKRIKPSSFEDIIAVNALYRPGPMEQIDSFIKRKKGKESITYPHDDLKDILEITYGIMVYQEQVMQVASKLAGYSLSEADQLRRTMSKKIQEDMVAGRKKFVNGAAEKGYTTETANNVYDYIDRFANYGFNRAHAVAYSMVAYQLAYFKAHYPLSFFTALMKAYSNSKNKLKLFSLEAKKRNVTISSPDVNTSEYTFIVKNSSIQFGLSGINGLRRDFVDEIIKTRKNKGVFRSLTDFAEKIDEKFLKSSYIEPLIYSGALDKITYNRATALKSLDSIIESVKFSGGSMTLFEITKSRENKVEEMSLNERLEKEFEVTGFYFSGHPSEKYNYLRTKNDISFIGELKENKNQRLLGLIRRIKTIQTKKGLPMSFVQLTDETGTVSLTLFPEEHRKFIKEIHQNDIIMVEGKTEKNGREPKMIVRKLQPQSELNQKEETEHVLFIRIESLENNQELFDQIQSILKQFPGAIPVIIYEDETKDHHQLKNEFSVDGSNKLLANLIELLGNENIVIR